jgi:formylglycine-generating enzyme required for sulfatase activity
MAHDVFISYSSKDKIIADAVCAKLENNQIRCWIAPRDILPGMEYGQALVEAIKKSRAVVLVLSSNSNVSSQVMREIERAVSNEIPIIPLRIENILPSESMEFYLSSVHWLDAITPPIEKHLDKLTDTVVRILGEKVSLEQGAVGFLEKAPPGIAGVPQSGLKSAQSGRKLRPLPLLITALAILLAVIAFTVWGMPLLVGRLAPTPTATSVPTPTPRLTFTLAPSLTPTIMFTPTLAFWTRPADGMAMEYVPEGIFIMGTNSANSGGQLVHNVFLDAFWIDKTDITNAMYSLCVKAGACQAPSQSNSSTRTSYFGNLQYDNYPVIWVNWEDASSYCQWAGARLPTEAQWEKAMRGTDGRPYPWGTSNPNKSLLNYDQNNGDTTTVDSYPSGASPYGALDMAGNVWDWVNDWYGANYFATSPSANPQGPSGGTFRVLRGGAWNNYAISFINSSLRDWQNSGYASNSVGFRCARPSP